ncbi:MAG: undecaprenyldiphospho-muramoylpentapeptide beta-N-acetylglucosaminyltransferase [Gammaproteobacteria bacterium]|nr:MAG: undecaprenyldiphospho-muramoylpentapeptide beta-N-acetylglucosaminyltransferase [Gammaproteobacteria bacterium]
MSGDNGRHAREVPSVLIMAGGTGGHVFPALAVARQLEREGARVLWLGTPGSFESRLIPPTGIPFHEVPVRGLRGKGWLGWLKAPLALARALLLALRALRKLSPDLVLGMGGYATGPGGVAARLLGKPLVIHEQNAVPGLTNRLLARIATRVLEAFPGSFPAPRRARHTGNPVREEVLRLPTPEQRLSGRTGPLRLLVLGGSQGARVLNEVVPSAIAGLADPGIVEVRHQTGEAHLQATRERYRAAGISAHSVAFIEDVAGAYGWADLVVSRAGALTISELAVAGVASVLVPFPHAVDDHQTRNGLYLVNADAAVLIRQSELNASRLGGLLAEFHGARERLLSMAVAARRLGIPTATRQVSDCCLELAHA